MGAISIIELKPGMELSKAIEIDGRVLAPEGTKISEKLIHRLKSWGVNMVEIKSSSVVDNVSEDLSSTDLDEIKAELGRRFNSNQNKNDLMREIARYLFKKQASSFKREE